MSKKLFNKLDLFLEQEPEDKELVDYVSELVMSNDPTNKTIATRYSNIKKYLRENYIGISEDTLKKLKPDDKIIQSIINSDAEKKNNKKNIHFDKDDVTKILELRDSSNVYDKGIYLQFISGRRINEIFDDDIRLTMLKNAPHKIKFSSLSKKTNDKPYVIQLIPDITAKEYRDEIYKLRKIVSGISLNDYNKRVNKRIKEKIGKEFTSHNLRGMYGVYLFNNHNLEDQNINGFISKVLNHDSSDASLHYSNYIYNEN
jgi:integrase